jgi:hypothetical protein
MTAQIILFVPKPNPKLIEGQAVEILKQINLGWLTEEQAAKIAETDKDKA